MADVTRLAATEWSRLRDIRLRALLDAPDAFGSAYDVERAYRARRWRELVGQGPWWVGVEAGTDLGLVAGGVHRENESPWVFSMWVDPLQRGTGLAEALIAEVIRWARGLGAPRLGLDVADRMPGARRFYERVGFRANGTAFPMPRDPSITLHELTLDLSASRLGSAPEV